MAVTLSFRLRRRQDRLRVKPEVDEVAEFVSCVVMSGYCDGDVFALVAGVVRTRQPHEACRLGNVRVATDIVAGQRERLLDNALAFPWRGVFGLV